MVPLCGVFKINWDTSIDKTKKMSVSIIVRDHERKVMATMCSSKPYIKDPDSYCSGLAKAFTT